MSGRQRELISSFRRPRTHPADFTPFSFFDFLSLSLFSSNVAGRWRINGFDRMTCDFSGIGQNNRSDISFFSISVELFLPGLRVIRKFYFTRPSLDRAANSRFSASRIKRDGSHVRETTWSHVTLAFLTAQKYKRIAEEIQRLGLSKASIITRIIKVTYRRGRFSTSEMEIIGCASTKNVPRRDVRDRGTLRDVLITRYTSASCPYRRLRFIYRISS